MSTHDENLDARLGRLGIHRRQRDPLAAAIRLESAMDAMHAAATAAGPAEDDAMPAGWAPYQEGGLTFCCQAGAESYPAPCPHHGAQAVDVDQDQADQLAAAVQLAPSTLTAAEFALLVDPLQPGVDQPAPADPVMEAARRHMDADLAAAWSPPEDLRSDHLERTAAVGDSAAIAPETTVSVAGARQGPAPATSPPAFSSERGRQLDWRSRHDVRSRDYGVTEHRLAGRAPLQDVLLDRGPVLDQGAEGACAGFAAVDAANSMDLAAWHRRGYAGAPADLLDADDALTLYERAKQLDDVPGENYQGTSILAAMKAGQEQGHWAGYLWAFGVRDIAQTLLQLRQAVVIGVPWGDRMEAAPAGLVAIGSDGPWLGHALAVVGLSMKGPNGEAGPFFIWQNSWGESYGAGGLGYVHHRDLAWLLSQDGEAAIPQGTL